MLQQALNNASIIRLSGIIPETLIQNRGNEEFQNSPDTASREKSELNIARENAKTIPALILLRQNGKEDDRWLGSPFW